MKLEMYSIKTKKKIIEEKSKISNTKVNLIAIR